jgi:hypothetical protein
VNKADGENTGTPGNGVRSGVVSAAVTVGPDLCWWGSRVLAWVACLVAAGVVLELFTGGPGWQVLGWSAVAVLIAGAALAARMLAHAACSREFDDDGDEGGW